jgi:acyl-CoA thioesterase-1
MKIAFQLSQARYGAAHLFRNITLATASVTLLALSSVAAQAETTIVALGDSLTAGYGLPEGEGLVPQLQNWLTAQGADIKVINAGVSGDTSAGGLSRLDWSLTPETKALVVTLGGNDLLRGIQPSETRSNIDTIVKQATDRGLKVLIVPMEAPGNFGPDYKAQFDALYPEIATAHGAAITQPFFRLLSPDATDPGQIAQWMQADGLHPNKDGVAKIVATLGPAVLDLAASTGN